ncbi:RNAi protein, Dsh1 [Schizosaccharomyces osmophilus]|uniref:RNAi protein, Dsh1 n=1 Tax=Schizosaccharomyces osmophilus TaxID=2545709 RepID=A0AAF0AZV9_9SCHI|nr:RNAi protein, Dsh1 [Schizosaccharomyces osmophilus]WBW75454.1 RNAi protein, Dsh1 [Schizosaccharomyces osmophilus]
MANYKASRDVSEESRNSEMKSDAGNFRQECILSSFEDISDLLRFFQKFSFEIRKIERRTLSKFEHDQASGRLFLNNEDKLRARVALDFLQSLMDVKRQSHVGKRASKSSTEHKKKVYNYQEKLESNKEKREKALLERYLQELDPALAFPYEGSLVISSDELDVYENFGGEPLVLLNPIRIKFHCHIDYSPKLSLIHIRCQNSLELKEALHHVKLFYFEQASYHRLERSCLSLHILNLDSRSNFNIFYDREFVLSMKFLPKRIHLRAIPSTSSSVANEETLEKIRNGNVQAMKNYILASFYNVYLFIGVVFMRVKVGVPLFERLKIGENETNTNSIQDASRILLEKQTKSSFLRYLAPNYVSERILSSMESIKDESGKQVFEAFGTNPLNVVHFTLNDIHNTKKNLTAIWDKPVGRPNRWYIDSNTKDTLSITHCNLNTLSWNLYIKYGKHTHDSQAYSDFASSIIMDNKNRIYFLNTSEVFVETVIVKLKHKFYHVPSGYHLHLTRFEAHAMGQNTFIDSDTQPGIQVYRVGQDTSVLRYGLSFWDPNWDRIFAENQHRLSGSSPTYKPSLQTIFPEGIEAFISHSQSIVLQVASLANQFNGNQNIFEADNSISDSMV